MNGAIAEPRICTCCDRKETLSDVWFCRNCGTILPGFGKNRHPGLAFTVLGAQIPISDLKPLTVPPPVSCPVDTDSAWVIDFGTLPPPPPPELRSTSTRRTFLLNSGLFLLGPIGLGALFIGGLIAGLMGHTNYALMAATLLVIGRLALYGVKRLRK